ncbi:MAG: hypothetical protein HYU39_10335 [Thaumarchaeota archaeon]|nr:hypothetical protein [Nitrososphaerota archaeon]
MSDIGSFLLQTFALLLVTVTVGFLVLLGESGMTGKAVTEGKVSIAEWGRSVRKYFVRILGLALIYVGLLVGVFTVVGVITIMPVILSMVGQAAQGQPPPSESAIMQSFAPVAIVFAVIAAFVQAGFYLLLAPAVVDDAGIGGSVEKAIRVLRAKYKAFLAYASLVCGIILVSSAPILLFFFSGFDVNLKVAFLPGNLSVAVLVPSIVQTIFSPLFFLIAFLIYYDASRPPPVGQA